MYAYKFPITIEAIKKLIPEQASATKKRPSGISIYNPERNKGTPVNPKKYTDISAVTSCKNGISSSPIGIENIIKKRGKTICHAALLPIANHIKVGNKLNNARCINS